MPVAPNQGHATWSKSVQVPPGALFIKLLPLSYIDTRYAPTYLLNCIV